jgi:hypothetical protein
MSFEEALEVALQHSSLTTLDFQNNPAALCLLSAKDERRARAGAMLRGMVCDGIENIQRAFFQKLEQEGVSRLATLSFWHAHEDITKRWACDVSLQTHCAAVTNKVCAVKTPVLFSIHVPRA